MRNDKLKAITLRKEGNSYNQISKTLKVPKSTLSYWLGDLKISKKSQTKILSRAYKLSVEVLIKRNKNQTLLAKKRAEDIRSAAKKESFGMMHDSLFLAGLALYWAEGYKKGANGSKWKSIDFVNSDPEMIKLIMKFFRKFLKINDSRIKIQLMTHKNIDVNKAVKFWSNLTRIPEGQFIKSCSAVSKSSKGKRSPNSLTYGTVHIRINDVKLFFRIIGWIDGLKEKI
jgi:hypothetical protein